MSATVDALAAGDGIPPVANHGDGFLLSHLTSASQTQRRLTAVSYNNMHPAWKLIALQGPSHFDKVVLEQNTDLRVVGRRQGAGCTQREWPAIVITLPLDNF